METNSSSVNRSQQLIISQAVNTIKQHRMEEILHRAVIYNIQDFVTELYHEHYVLENIEDAYKKVRYFSFVKLKRRWVQATIRNFQESRGPKKEFRARYEMISSYYQVVGPEGFQKGFHVKTIEDYMNLYINEIDE